MARAAAAGGTRKGEGRKGEKVRKKGGANVFPTALINPHLRQDPAARKGGKKRNTKGEKDS